MDRRSIEPGGGRDEAALVERARRGDGAAFEAIVTIYERRILAYCHRMAGRAGRGGGAEDLAQDVFVKLFLAMPRFEAGRPIGPLLFRIAHNHCIDAIRRGGSGSEIIGADPETVERAAADEWASVGMSPEREAGMAQETRAVEDALESLSPAYRSVLVMRHVDGLTYEEIAEALGVPMGTVKARIHRGREMLQQKLRGIVVP